MKRGKGATKRWEKKAPLLFLNVKPFYSISSNPDGKEGTKKLRGYKKKPFCQLSTIAIVSEDSRVCLLRKDGDKERMRLRARITLELCFTEENLFSKRKKNPCDTTENSNQMWNNTYHPKSEDSVRAMQQIGLLGRQ